jgi:ketosteroid isomerase-like protein
MARKIDLNTIAKEYAEGRISKEDFLYLHKMLSSQQTGATQPPPVLRTAAQQQAQRRTIRPGAGNQNHQQPPVLQPANHGTLPPQFSPQATQEKSGGFFRYFRTHHKEAVALLGTLGLFISMFYNKIDLTPPAENTARIVVVKESNEQHSPRIRTQDIKLIAQLMMEDNGWNSELIEDFKNQWNKLTENEKKQIKKTEWYFDFSSMLSQQIKTSRTKAKTGDVSSIYNQQALLSLADALIFGNSENAEKMLAKISQENRSSSIEAKQETSGSAKQDKKQISPKQKSETVASLKKKENSGKSTEPLKRHRISRSEIEEVINRFTVAFEAGHTRELADLFADDEYSSSFASLNAVKSEYRELFRNTRDRQLDFDSFFWEHDFDEARGTAKYNARVRMLDANINKTISADVDITLRRLLGKIYITNFKLKEKKIVSSSPKFIKDLTKDISTKDKPKFPTPAELQDLVTQYVTAYETGDVKELMQLFANATWTKSRTGLVEMKQNYQDLFNNTSDREVFIKDVKWEIKGDKALGTGELLLTLHSGDNKVETKKGKIRIVARKSKDLVRFTQMFHVYN